MVVFLFVGTMEVSPGAVLVPGELRVFSVVATVALILAVVSQIDKSDITILSFNFIIV